MDVLREISLSIASLEQAIVAETLNISCSGLFVRVAPPGVRVGEHVHFVLTLVSALGGADAGSINPLDKAARD